MIYDRIQSYICHLYELGIYSKAIKHSYESALELLLDFTGILPLRVEMAELFWLKTEPFLKGAKGLTMEADKKYVDPSDPLFYFVFFFGESKMDMLC